MWYEPAGAVREPSDAELMRCHFDGFIFWRQRANPYIIGGEPVWPAHAWAYDLGRRLAEWLEKQKQAQFDATRAEQVKRMEAALKQEIAEQTEQPKRPWRWWLLGRREEA